MHAVGPTVGHAATGTRRGKNHRALLPFENPTKLPGSSSEFTAVVETLIARVDLRRVIYSHLGDVITENVFTERSKFICSGN